MILDKKGEISVVVRERLLTGTGTEAGRRLDAVKRFQANVP